LLNSSRKIIFVFDDREFVSRDVGCIVGVRRFGDIICKGESFFKRFERELPAWARLSLVRVLNDEDVSNLRSTFEKLDETSVCVIAGRAGFPLSSERDEVRQLIERLPYAESDFSSSSYKPLLKFFHNSHNLMMRWDEFSSAPVHTWEVMWQEDPRLTSLQILDMGDIHDILNVMSGATSARHFNEMSFDTYYYTKRSSDKRKMRAEYAFYGLVPERMQSWLVKPFDFKEEGGYASYKMLRYFLADVSIQWVHGAFTKDSFVSFIDRLLFFIEERPRRICDKKFSLSMAHELFLGKLMARIDEFMNSDIGRKINNLAASADPRNEIKFQLERYTKAFDTFSRGFSFGYSVIGHGDPCFSNILYEQRHQILKLIDPKGAVVESELWMHPLYDLCKISHSVLGDYDFINSGVYSIGFKKSNEIELHHDGVNRDDLKSIFICKLNSIGYDVPLIRLGEASLFLSMLPMHLDNPNKVLAFMLKAKQILDEVENEG